LIAAKKAQKAWRGLQPQPKLENHEEFCFGDYSHEVPLAFVFFFSSW